MEKNGKTFIKGLVIGATMTVPGVSGGSMAMVLGIYDRLLKHVSEITKYPKESLTFLLWFAAGAGSGAFLFSRGISWLLTTRAEGILCFFFLGAVAGGIPMILKSASVSRIRGREMICILTGILTALLRPDPSGDICSWNRKHSHASAFPACRRLYHSSCLSPSGHQRLPDALYAWNL